MTISALSWLFLITSIIFFLVLFAMMIMIRYIWNRLDALENAVKWLYDYEIKNRTYSNLQSTLTLFRRNHVNRNKGGREGRDGY